MFCCIPPPRAGQRIDWLTQNQARPQERRDETLKPFEELYQIHYSRIYAFLFRLCRDQDLAEELTQESFYQAFASFHQFKGKSEPYTWLVAIAKHVYFRYLRKKKQSLDVIDLSLVIETYSSNNRTPQETLEQKELEAALRTLINRIPEKYRDVIMLRIYAELPFAQVASLLNISENSAKVIYYRAKKMLMEELNHGNLM